MSTYTPEQQRVADYIVECTNDQIGAGEDPIGFLIAAHGLLIRDNKKLRDFLLESLLIAYGWRDLSVEDILRFDEMIDSERVAGEAARRGYDSHGEDEADRSVRIETAAQAVAALLRKDPDNPLSQTASARALFDALT